ncbi:hypothetical protein [Novosphingopyxis iocasae]|uniref:hypothetical protein n=1 Tax=Novosphingopyxis iocasae TaxID=2762729 RepID=UPI00165138B4|nr:hypothetical protein [Novosphingopyxis iocasae]
MKAFWISAAMALLAVSAPAAAQDYGDDQAAATELRNAIERLARSPTDGDALLDAGNAALILRDYDSALRFFSRAEAIQPSSGRVKAGLATAQLYNENPVEALKLYDQAIALGISERSIAADRGLAMDLVGNNAQAQAEYALGSTAISTDNLIIRQAVSFGLSGDQKRAEALLNPLLSQNNPLAWRARAFILASNGDVSEATRIVRGFLDARSTAAMQSYLERMPQLTRAQQAAVIHYGHFPADAQVGRDSAAVRAIASANSAARPGAATQDSGLIPSGEPLGRRTRTRAEASVPAKPTRAERRAAAQAQREAARTARAATAPRELPAVATRTAAPAQPRTANAAPAPSEQSAVSAETSMAAKTSTAGELPAISQPVATSAAAATQPPAAEVQTAAVGPGFEALGNPEGLAEWNAQQSAPAAATAQPTVVASIDSNEPAAASQSAVADTAGSRESLNAIVRAIDIPAQERTRNVFAEDLARLEQYKNAKPLGPAPTQSKAAEPSPFASLKKIPEGAKPLDAADKKAANKAEKPAASSTKSAEKKPAAKEEPARNWVQIATGASGAMKGEYRRLSRGKTELFKGQKGWTSPFKTQERLLVGPFDSIGAARDWLKKFQDAGGDGFAWNSGAGTAVTPLP